MRKKHTTKNIHAIEDEPVVLRFVSQLLDLEGHRILEAEDGD